MTGGRLSSATPIVRIAAFSLVAAAIAVASMTLHQRPNVPGGDTDLVSLDADPLGGALKRCQAEGLAAQTDGGCEAIWAESRRRFFGTPKPADGPPSSTAPLLTPTR